MARNRWLHPWFWRCMIVLVLLAASGIGAVMWIATAPQRQAEAALMAAEGRWSAARSHHYFIEVRVITLHSGETFRLEVRDETVVAGWTSSGAALSATKLGELQAYFPIATLFERTRAEISRPTSWRERLGRAFPPLMRWILPCPLRTPPSPIYDDQLGYPRKVLIDLSSCQLYRDGTELRIDNLQVLRSPYSSDQ